MGAGSAYKQMIVYLFTTFLRYKIMVPLEPVMLVSICPFNKHLENNALCNDGLVNLVMEWRTLIL